ncbi:Stk1 family PASTA domain-containing Ser/Thr kinase [Tropheryma whipplei]|uniref:non-specific serine/threonine protein kinase n=1 Tax=Tropheryma whipplei (strain Twist) TaxID=203267 RepID=Q83GN9_TROWT|nr:PASTA domain-containing protein [Tropheryma whipplei]AAO44313.1 serine/threonine-protein kinase [Tropheryma whipplei str. Twist]MCO8183046.1 PASTA domain-containing protein [Tropheryma whipplei]MCO8190673.1 PASTA domain-containing protein [Tropheryma whipplei]CAD67221.1 putative eukaryotic-type serine/threonine protein kinase [Tropheryma whipplei TW08/27]
MRDAASVIGMRIADRYLITEKIASGGMATVYKGKDIRLKRDVSIKIMHDHLVDDPKFTEKFIAEAQLAAGISNANIVNVFDQGRENRIAYMVMEYVPGITLRKLLREKHVLTVKQTLEIITCVLEGLSSAHKSGLIHRDIKPENILIGNNGQIKLGDFGLSRLASNNTTTGTGLLGTIAYLSPELITRSEADTRSDVYAIGIMLFELLTGQQPFHGKQPMEVAHKHANLPMPKPSAVNPGVPSVIDDIVLWACSKNPEQRPSDASVLLNALKKINLENEYSTIDATEIIDFGASENKLKTPQKKMIIKLLVVIALPVVLVSSGFVSWYFIAGPGSTVEITDLAGLTPEEIKEQLEKKGLTVTISQKYDKSVPSGGIINLPSAGTAWERDKTLELDISLGPRVFDIKGLAGLPISEALSLLRDRDIKIYRQEEHFSGTVSSGLVISVKKKSGDDISHGGRVSENDELYILSSLGAIPNLIGMPEEDAKEALANAGLAVGAITQEYNDNYPKGRVIRQTPSGDPVTKGSAINFVVSKGPDLVIVPNLTGKTLHDAVDALTSLGFRVYLTTSIPLDARPAKIITTPSAGTAVKRGSRVTVTTPG